MPAAGVSATAVAVGYSRAVLEEQLKRQPAAERWGVCVSVSVCVV